MPMLRICSADALARSRPDRHHGEHRRNSDDHPEGRQRGTQLVSAQRSESGARLASARISGPSLENEARGRDPSAEDVPASGEEVARCPERDPDEQRPNRRSEKTRVWVVRST